MKPQLRGWLDTDQPLPPDETLASVFDAPKKKRARQSSSLEPHRDQITSWFEDGVQGTTIHDALKRRHGFTGSYSAVRRFLHNLADATPRVTTVLEFAPGDTAQVDFGQGPKITDVHTGELVQDLVLHHDTGLESASVRRAGTRSVGRDLARLSPARLRAFFRRTGSDSD